MLSLNRIDVSGHFVRKDAVSALCFYAYPVFCVPVRFHRDKNFIIVRLKSPAIPSTYTFFIITANLP